MQYEIFIYASYVKVYKNICMINVINSKASVHNVRFTRVLIKKFLDVFMERIFKRIKPICLSVILLSK